MKTNKNKRYIVLSILLTVLISAGIFAYWASGISSATCLMIL